MNKIAFAELRLYSVQVGRMSDMSARYQQHLSLLFARHGITVIGAWQCFSGPQTPLFVYLMHWQSWEERTIAWHGFYSDPQWSVVREATNAGSELVERYDLNLLKPLVPIQDGTALPREIQLLIPKVKVGQGPLAAKALSKAMEAPSGQGIVGAYEFLTGNDLPRACLFIDHEALSDVSPVWEMPPFDRADVYALTPL